jgi:hypothetical protein
MQVKGHAAPETKAAAERARLLIEEAQARGEPVDDPLLLFSVLYSFWVAAHGAFNGDMMRALKSKARQSPSWLVMRRVLDVLERR